MATPAKPSNDSNSRPSNNPKSGGGYVGSNKFNKPKKKVTKFLAGRPYEDEE